MITPVEFLHPLFTPPPNGGVKRGCKNSVGRLQILRDTQDDREKGFQLKFKQALKEYEQITCPQIEEEPFIIFSKVRISIHNDICLISSTFIDRSKRKIARLHLAIFYY